MLQSAALSLFSASGLASYYIHDAATQCQAYWHDPITVNHPVLHAMSTEEQSDEIPPEYIKIYMLTTLTENEEKGFLEAISGPVKDGLLAYMTPQLVHWTSDVDGSVEQDLLRMWKDIRRPDPQFDAWVPTQQIFADKKSVKDGGTIVVDQDWPVLACGPEARRQSIKMAEERGIKLPRKYWEIPDWLYEDTMDLWYERGLLWSRFPGVKWKSAWANLDIGNMHFGEQSDYNGDGCKTILDPEWDPEPFFERVKEIAEEIKRLELGTGA